MSFLTTGRTLVANGPIDEMQPAPPPWSGPPRGVLAGMSAQRAVIFRTERAVLVAKQFEVYPSGVEFTIDLRLNGDDGQWFDTPWEPQRHGLRRKVESEIPEDLLRLGIEFSDGQTWSNVASPTGGWRDPPDGPVLMGRGGGGGGDQWEMRYWLWPLPPDGDLVFHAAWPALDIDEVAVSISATALRETAANSEVLWT